MRSLLSLCLLSCVGLVLQGCPQGWMPPGDDDSAGDDDDDSGDPNDGSGCARAGCSGSIADVPASAAAIFLLPLALRRRRFSGT